MPDEAETVAALFRRALQPRRDPRDVERDAIEKLVGGAIERHARRQLRQMLRTVFARLVVELGEQGWTSGEAGPCTACGSDSPRRPLWSKRRPHYVTCPRGHCLHVECLHLVAAENTLGVEASCPCCYGPG